MNRRLIPLAMGTFAVGTATFVIAGILPVVSSSFGVSVTTAGQLVTVFAIAYAVGSPLFAAAAGRWPRRALPTIALAVFVVGNIATALAPTFALMLGSRVLAAIGAALFMPTASAVAATLVAPEQRGRALAVVVGGQTVATALSVPIGTALGTAVGWRGTMWFVAALGVVAALGIIALLPAVPTPQAIGLRRRLAPLGDGRVAMVLLTTLLVLTGPFTVYTYISLSYDRATGGSGTSLAILLLGFGVGALVGNFGAGSFVDRLGSRTVLSFVVAVAAVNFALMPLSSAYFPTALVAIVVWGVCVWAIVVPQQHRLIALSPDSASLVIALNASAVWGSVALSGPIGAAGIGLVGAHRLGLLAAGFMVLGLLASEVAFGLVRRREKTEEDAPTTTAGPESSARKQEEGGSPARGRS